MSEKIKKWHEDVHLQKKGEFEHDSEFVNIISSPNDFSDENCTSEDEPMLEMEIENQSTMPKQKRFGLKPTKQRSYLSNMDVTKMSIRPIGVQKKKSSFLTSVNTIMVDSPYLANKVDQKFGRRGSMTSGNK